MVGKNLINKETLEILKPINVKLARFYLLPKIHKKEIILEDHLFPQLTVTQPNCLNTYDYIQQLVKEIKPYICNTTDFPNKINDIKTIPQEVLVTMNVKHLYSMLYTEISSDLLIHSKLTHQQNE